MSAFYKRLAIKEDAIHGSHIYLDGEEVKGCIAAKLELSRHTIPLLTLTVILDAVDIDINAPIGVEYEETEPET